MKPRLAARQLSTWETRSVSHSSCQLELLDRAGVPHENEEVVTGVLHNPRLRRAYPIVHGVPRMLLFSTGVSRAFQREHGDRVTRELPGVSLPNGQAMPGEEEVLRTFPRSEYVELLRPSAMTPGPWVPVGLLSYAAVAGMPRGCEGCDGR